MLENIDYSDDIKNTRATRCEININSLRNNIQIFRNKIADNCSLCLSAKANAYGHGDKQIAHYTEDIVDFFAVATVYEGVKLRESGITKPILLLSAHTKSEIPYICKNNLSPFLSHNKFLDDYDHFANYYNTNLSIHMKVDTGMSRAGFGVGGVLQNAKKIEGYKNIHIEGLCTHFASSDDIIEGREFTKNQIDSFTQVIDKLKDANIEPKYIHAANSAATENYKDSHFNMVRVGIAAYGYSDDEAIVPVMTLKSKLTIIKKISNGTTVSYGRTWRAKKDTIIGIVPIGYADGYKRCLSNKSDVLVGDKLCPVIGTICMDQIAIELPDSFGQNDLEKDVIIFSDNRNFDASMLAKKADTIVYEILTSISERVPRVYIK